VVALRTAALALLSLGLVGAGASAAVPVEKTLRLGAPPVALVVARGAVWVVVETKPGAARLWKLDARTGKRLSSTVIGPAGPDIGAATSTSTAVWAAAGDHIVRIDLARAGGERRAQLPGTVSGVAVGAGSVWVTTIGAQRNLLVRLDPKTLAVLARIPTTGGDAVAVALGSVWVAGGGALERLSANGDRLTAVLPAIAGVSDLAAAPDRLWLLDGRIAVAVDRTGQARRRIMLPFAAARLTVSANRIWTIDRCGCALGALAETDLRTGHVVASWAVGFTPVAVAAAGNQVWVASFGNSTLLRVRV
jgi:DNA-binding beta-propeller fold protein YncE